MTIPRIPEHSPVPVYKRLLMTPYQCVQSFIRTYQIETVVSYAGRLDPMAEGVLLLLLGDANKERRKYEHMDKEYDVDILCGLRTDTGDLMGLVVDTVLPHREFNRVLLERVVDSCVGTHDMPYPAFSSAKVQGKPLYYYARRGELHTVTIPRHSVRIDEAKVTEVRSLTSGELEHYTRSTIPYVKGDFRQEKIMSNWEKVWQSHPTHVYTVIRVHVSCGSGAYMRSLAEYIGGELGIPMCAMKIKRTRVGRYGLKECLPVTQEEAVTTA